MASYYISIDDYVPTSYYNANWQYYYGGSNYKKINGLTENAFNQSTYYLKSKNYTLASYTNYQNGIPCYSSSLSVIYKNKNYYSVITEITANNDGNIRNNYFKGPCYVWDLNLGKYIEKNHNKYLYYKERGEGQEYIEITNFAEDLPLSLENYDYEIQEENNWY